MIWERATMAEADAPVAVQPRAFSDTTLLPDSASASLTGGNETWRHVGPVPTAVQGWKLYISGNNANFADLLAAVRPVLGDHTASYKHVADERILQRLNSGLEGYSQIGKTIVVYIEDASRALPLLDELKTAVRDFAGSAITPPFANPVGGGLPLSYRYGAFAGDTISIDGVQIPDDRSRKMSGLQALPPDPFLPALEAKPEERGLDSLLLAYPVFEVISQSAKGGVFAAMDLDAPEFREVVIKLGRRNGNLLPDGRDGMDLLRHEKWFFDVAAGHGMGGHIPGLIAYAEFSASAALVMERIDGETLHALQLRGALEARHVVAAAELLGQFHDAGLLVGDAKLANVMLTEGGALKVIDFETAAFVEARTKPDQHSTFLFTDSRLRARPAVWEKLHFLYSVLHAARHEEEAGKFDERTRIIDLGAVLGTVPETEAAAAALKMIRDIVSSEGLA
jgi:hypothetical protein